MNYHYLNTCVHGLFRFRTYILTHNLDRINSGTALYSHTALLALASSPVLASLSLKIDNIYKIQRLLTAVHYNTFISVIKKTNTVLNSTE